MLLCLLYALLSLLVVCLVCFVVYFILAKILAMMDIAVDARIWQCIGLIILLVALIYFVQAGMCGAATVLRR